MDTSLHQQPKLLKGGVERLKKKPEKKAEAEITGDSGGSKNRSFLQKAGSFC